MRNKTLAFAPLLAVAGALLFALGSPAPAEAARIGFSVHGGFHVGGVHFSVGLHSPGRFYRPGYFYRTYAPVAYRGYSCGSACYRHAGAFYHHSACPLVRHHFRRHGYVPPRHGWDDRYGYRDGTRYDRRYDERYRYRYDRRYDRRYDGRYRDWDGDSDSDSDRWERRRYRRYDGRRERAYPRYPYPYPYRPY